MSRSVCSLLTSDLSKWDERMAVFKWVLEPIRVLMENAKFSPDKEFINPYLLTDVLARCKKDLLHFDGPDAFKIGGHICYWMARLKPFRAITGNSVYANETMAIKLGLCIVWEGYGRKSLNEKVIANLIYDLRYGHASPMAVTNQFQLLYSS